MAGSLDNGKPMVLGAADYDYLILAKGKRKTEIWLSPQGSMPPAEIAKELRQIAAWIEDVQVDRD